MKVGDSIRLKGKLAPVNYGTIVAILDGEYYNAVRQHDGIELTTWDEAFPDWKSKNVFYIKKGLAIAHVHLEKFDIDDSCNIKHIENTKYISVPEDDVELYDWIAGLEKQI